MKSNNKRKLAMKKILIIGGNNTAGLAIIQSLGRYNHAIDVIGITKTFNKCFYSKFIRKKYIVSNPEPIIDSFCEEILLIIVKEKYDIIIPTNDRFALILSLNELRNKIKNSYIAVPEYNKLILMMDKANALKTSLKFKCPIPHNTIFTDKKFLKNFDDNAKHLKYPVVLKPRFSWFLDGKYLKKSTVLFISNEKNFRKGFLKSHKNIPFPIIQNQIKGDAWGIELLAKNGNIVSSFSHKRVRESNPQGGFSSAVKSIPLNKKYVEFIEQIVKETKWDGVCMFEFKNDDDDDIPKLIEINARFWGSLPVAVASGVDFPKQLIDSIDNIKIKSVNYRKYVYARWIIADLTHLLRVLKGKPKGWKGYYPKRIETLKEILKISKYKSYNNELLDPLPGTIEMFVEPYLKIKRFLL